MVDEIDPAAVGARVRARRRALGWSQEDLAARTGISRQALGALENGRHLPRADAAVALARRLETTVEALLAGPSVLPRHVLFGSLAEGQAVRVARVGDRTVCFPVPSPDEGERWRAPDAVIRDGVVEALPDADLDGFVLVGCDPALGVLADLAPPRGPGSLLTVTASSGQALRALASGRAHAALVHDLRSQLQEVATAAARVGERLPFARWRVGLAAPFDAEHLLDAALAGVGPVVQRDRGAASQRAYERALAESGASAPAGPRVGGHVAAARRALEDGAVAVTSEPAARAAGLRFHPLETHEVEIHLGADTVDHPGAAVVRELVSSVRFRRRVAALPGYEVV